MKELKLLSFVSIMLAVIILASISVSAEDYFDLSDPHLTVYPKVEEDLLQAMEKADPDEKLDIMLWRGPYGDEDEHLYGVVPDFLEQDENGVYRINDKNVDELEAWRVAKLRAAEAYYTARNAEAAKIFEDMGAEVLWYSTAFADFHIHATPDVIRKIAGLDYVSCIFLNHTYDFQTGDVKIYGNTGDADGNGKVTARDARLALRASARLENLSADRFAAADLNGDGRITAGEARKILRVSAGLSAF